MISKLINSYLSHRYRRIDAFANHPIQTQENQLKHLLACGANTIYGQKFGFGNVRNKDDFRNLVPTITYEELRPYLELIINEKRQNVLWNTPVKWFAMSSGTTEARSKYIPVTEQSLFGNHYECGSQMLSLYAHSHPDSRFLLGKTLTIGGSKQFNHIGGGIYTGDISAILIKNLRLWTKYGRTPEHIALLTDWEEKLPALVAFALKNDIRAFMGVPSWLLLVLKEVQQACGKPLNQLWHNIEVFFHGGVNFEPYRTQYAQLLGEEMRYWETYNASEGFFGVQFSPSSKDLLLMLDSGIYYEFIPLSEWDSPAPRTLTLDEVKPYENYAMVITTNGGLWRYRLGDTIEFTSVKPYLFRITGRTKSFINAFGEELIVDNADRAIAEACQKTGAIVREYTAAPIYFSNSQKGAHEWLIEFEKSPSNMTEFVRLLDETLKSLNSDYEAKRTADLSLRSPVVHALPDGSFASWMKSVGRIGGQNKVPKLMNERSYVDKILAHTQKTS